MRWDQTLSLLLLFPTATAFGNFERKKKKQVQEVSLDPNSSKENLPSGPHTLMTQVMERVSDLVSASN